MTERPLTTDREDALDALVELLADIALIEAQQQTAAPSPTTEKEKENDLQCGQNDCQP